MEINENLVNVNDDSTNLISADNIDQFIINIDQSIQDKDKDKDKNEIMDKKTILVVGEGPHLATGFAKVTREVITRWLATGKYRIVVMATNDRGDYHPMKSVSPDLIIEPLPYIMEDPYGVAKFPELLRKYDPDLVWALQDIWVFTGDERTPGMDQWLFKACKAYKPYLPVIIYFPVDGEPWDPKWIELVNNVDHAATFTDWGFKVLNERTPGINKAKIHKIHHGHDNTNFFPFPENEKEEIRKNIRKQMNIPEDAYLVLHVARNQPRKHIPSSIEAFKMFQDGYIICEDCGKYKPRDLKTDCQYCGCSNFKDGKEGVKNAYLYLHMNPMDMRGYRIPNIQRNYKAANVILAPNFDVANGIPVEELNKIYNASDVLVNPSISGGYELSPAEAQACKIPIIVTRSTSMTELANDGKGWLVNAGVVTMINDANCGFKHFVDVNKFVDALYEVYENKEEVKNRVEKAYEFSLTRSWDDTAKQFENLIDKCLNERIELHLLLDKNRQNIVFVNESNNFGNVLSSIHALNALVKTYPQVKFIYAVKNRMLTFFKHNNNFTVINIEKMWLDKNKLAEFNLQINPIEDMPYKYEKSLIGILPTSNIPSYIEAFSHGLNVQLDYNNLEDIISINNDSYPEIDEMLSKYDGKVKVAMLINLTNPNYGLNINSWKQACKFSARYKSDTAIFAIGMPDDLKEMEADELIYDKTLRQIIYLLSKMDGVITSSEEYCHLANVLDTKFILLQGPKTFEHIVKHAKRTPDIISSQAKFNCMPCMKDTNMPCKLTGDIFAPCTRDIPGGTIFTKVISLRKEILSKKESEQINEFSK